MYGIDIEKIIRTKYNQGVYCIEYITVSTQTHISYEQKYKNEQIYNDGTVAEYIMHRGDTE